MVTPFPKRYLAALVPFLSMWMTGCNGPSNNIAAPVTPTASSCTTDGCVTAFFLDEPVGGLNYECDTVKAVTAADGSLSCPNDSVATFYLQAANGTRKMILGTAKIHRPTSLTGFVNPNFVFITPKDLVSGGQDLISLSADNITGRKITNILRFLQAMDSSGSPAVNSPSRRIAISEEDKKALENLDKDFSEDLFGSESFDDLVKPVLSNMKVPRSLPKSQDAQDRFLANEKVTLAGGYEVSPLALQVSVDNAGTLGDYAMTGRLGDTVQITDGNGNVINEKTNYAVESLLFILDREAKMIGTGLEWQNEVQSNPVLGSTNIPQSVAIMYLYSKPKVLRPVSSDVGFQPNGDVKPGFDFQVLDDNNAVDGYVGITQGRLERGFLFGYPQKYRELFGLGQSEPVDSKYMGKWIRRNSSNAVPAGGTYSGAVTLQRTRYQIDPFLDPAYWKTQTNSTAGQTPIFPMHLQLTLRDNNKDKCAPDGCTFGPIGISILENGNIVSDINNDCNAGLNPATMKDLSGQQEYRLGLVTAILHELNSHFVSPLILIPDMPGVPVWQDLRGTLIGMTTGAAGGKRVKLNITKAADRSFGISDASAANSTADATWVNYVNFLKFSQLHPTDLSARIPEAQGIITSVTAQTCYTPTPL